MAVMPSVLTPSALEWARAGPARVSSMHRSLEAHHLRAGAAWDPHSIIHAGVLQDLYTDPLPLVFP